MKETHDTRTELISTSRRNVLRGAGAVGALSIFGVPAFSGSALADENGSSIDLACELDIMLAVDASGSLSSGDAIALQDGVNAFVDRLPDDGTVQVGSLEFAAGQVRKLNGLQAPDDLAVAVEQNPKGDTPMPGALDIADQILYGDAAARPTAGKLIVMFTDGGPNYETKWSDPINYTLGGYDAPRDDTTDWSAVADGNSVYDNDDGGIANVSAGEMEETAGVAASIKNGTTGGGATAIATVYVDVTGNLTNAMTSNAVNTYTDLPTYLETQIASSGLAIEGELADIEALVDDLVAAINENCVDCLECEDVDGVKYEFECVETNDDDECVDWDFVLEGDGDDGITYMPGSFTSKEGEMYEPMTVDFGTEYCDLYVLVKSGQELEVQSFEDIDGSITVETVNDAKYAISFVQFFCKEQDASDALPAFPSKGR